MGYRIRIGTLLVSTVVAGCSLMGLGEFDIPQCEEEGTARNEPCQVLNDQHGLSEQDCMIYQCSKEGPGCELRERDWDNDSVVAPQCADRVAEGTEIDCDDSRADRSPGNLEICDGIDNDCDMIIDEGSIAPRETHISVEDAEEVENAVYTREIEGQIGVVYQSSDKTAHWSVIGVSGSDLPPKESLHYAYQLEQDNPGINTAPANGCPETLDSTELCNFADISADRVGGDWLVAAVNTQGCGAGQLRIGHLDADSSNNDNLVIRGPFQHSNIFRGIDREGPCTGGSRGEPLGAARPAVAAQVPENGLPQALIAWLGDTVERDRCGGGTSFEEVDVEVIGAWREICTNTDPDMKWTSATNFQSDSSEYQRGALPQQIGRTRGGGRPAIVSWEKGRGYFLAYGDADGGVSLHFIPVFDDPEKYEYLSTAIRSTDPLEFGQSINIDAGSGGNPDHVVLAPGRYDDNSSELEIGVAWQEGCGTDSSSVWFCTITFTAGPNAYFTASDPIEVVRTDDSGRKQAQTIAYLPAGLVTNGYERNGETADESSSGGWVVAWTDWQQGVGLQMLARRILELDGRLIEEDPIRLSATGDDPNHPALYHAGDGLLGFVFHDGSNNSFVTGGLLCDEQHTVE